MRNDETSNWKEACTHLKHLTFFVRAAWVFIKVVACARTRDRGRFLPEWVTYHWAMGVDEIAIYDDGSVDDTREVWYVDTYAHTYKS